MPRWARPPPKPGIMVGMWEPPKEAGLAGSSDDSPRWSRLRRLLPADWLLLVAGVITAGWAGARLVAGQLAGFSLFGETERSAFESAAGDAQARWAGLGASLAVIGLALLLIPQATNRARRFWVFVLVVGAVLSTVHGGKVRASALHPLARYERELEAFPTVSGSRLTQRNKGGPTFGEVPSADRVWQTDRPLQDTCAAAKAAFRRWARDIDERDRGLGCFVRGTRHGIDAYIDVDTAAEINVPPGTEAPDRADGDIVIRVALVAG